MDFATATLASPNSNAYSQGRFDFQLGHRAIFSPYFRSLQNNSTSRQGSSSSLTIIQSSGASRDVNSSSRARFMFRPECPATLSSSFRLQSSISRTEGRCGYERTLLLARNDDATKKGGAGRARELWMLVPRAAVKEEQPELASVGMLSTLKDFLEDLKAVGRVRLIVNTGVAVLESVTSLEKLYYHVTPRGEYANVVSRDDNVDFHLLAEKVAFARLLKGKKGDIPTYMVRLVDVNNSAAVSVLVMWKPGTDGEYDPGQVEEFEDLVAKYGEEVKFSA